jgi:hypothetical protein
LWKLGETHNNFRKIKGGTIREVEGEGKREGGSG